MRDLTCMSELDLGNSKIKEIENVSGGEYRDYLGNLHTDLPHFCRVRVHRTNSLNTLTRMEIWLPDDWNGIFLATGNGGIGADILYFQLAQYVKQGYAVVNTDLGTGGGVNSGINNPELHKDFGWRATYLMTVEGKKITRAYYNQKEKYSYFVGNSTGGQQGYMLAERFPKEYDGIVAGVPANNRVFLHTYFLWNYVCLRDKNGNGLFNNEQVQAINKFAVEYFGQNEDFIVFPYNDEKTVPSFLEYLSQRIDLSHAQTDALYKLYNGPVNPKTGEQIYCGMPIGAVGADNNLVDVLDCQKACPYDYPFIWAFGENFKHDEFDFDSDLDSISALLSKHLNANSANLHEFSQNGSKLIAFSGSADSVVPFADAIKYYNRVCDALGGYQNVSRFFRYFILPGKDHGRGGRGANCYEDFLLPLRRWVEQGKAPEYISVCHNQNGLVTHKLSVYPYKSDKLEKKDFPKGCDEKYLNC